MFLVTLICPWNAKLFRKVFHYLNDAENYCDYSASVGWGVWSLDKVEIVEW